VTVAAEYHLIVREGRGGRLEVVSGLPEDREDRLSVLWRLADAVAVLCHQDAHGLSTGQAWQRYAKTAFVNGWLKDGAA
jgi:hypothetical protein